LDNITVFSLPVKRIGYYTIMIGLFKLLQSRSFDIVHIHGYGTYVGDVVCLLKRLGLYNVHLVLTTHGIAGLKLGYLAVNLSNSLRHTDRIRGLVHHFLYDFIVARLNINSFDRVVILSEEEGIYLSKIGLRKEKCVRIPIAINELFFSLTPSIPAPSRDTILYVGRIDRYKGIRTLMDAIKELRSTGINLKCIVVGKDCGYLSKLESHINRLGISDLVEVKDFVPQEKLIDLYSSALVTVLTSEFEAFPLAPVESMALGTPFITTPVGAIPELVHQTAAGIVVPLNSPKSLAQSIYRLYNDRDLWSRMSSNGKRIAINFKWETVAKQYYDVYSEIIQC
jgi:glycosyltransferase involved in cell wall biosynthesis